MMKLLKLLTLIIAGIALTLQSCVKETMIEAQPILEKATSRSSTDIEQRFRTTLRSVAQKLDDANRKSNGALEKLLNQLQDLSNEDNLKVLRSARLLDVADLVSTAKKLQSYGDELIRMKGQVYLNNIIGNEIETNFLTSMIGQGYKPNILGNEIDNNFIFGEEVGINFLMSMAEQGYVINILGNELNDNFIINEPPSWQGRPFYSADCDCRNQRTANGIAFYMKTCSEVMLWGLFRTGNWNEPIIELGTC